MKFILIVLFQVINFFSIFIPVLLSVAFLTLVERKVMGSIQHRRGPNVVGFFGILQPIADGIKLLLKEPVIPYRSNKVIFIASPIFTFIISIVGWSVIPLSEHAATLRLDVSVLLILGISSLGVYGIILAGWASNSKYAFMGGLRSAAQMIAYEVSLSLTVLPVIAMSSSLNFAVIVERQEKAWFIFSLLPAAVGFAISILAETNRTPFDLPEAEGELVAGFNVEYSAFSFAMFFLAEYSNIILMSALFSLFFLGGWNCFVFTSSLCFLAKISLVLYWFIWVRASVPRYRYDQLMQLGWKVLLPFVMGYFLFTGGFIFFIKTIYDSEQYL